MAKSTMNELLKALHGSIGGFVFRTMPDGSVWVSTAPNFSRRTFSRGQKAHQKRFREATLYARAAQTNPVYVDLAAGTMKTAYNMALADKMKPPVIHEVRHMDGRILAQASDNVLVTQVVVMILSEHGEVVEKGEAVKYEGDWWEYTPQRTGTTTQAESRDLAGNTTRASKAL